MINIVIIKNPFKTDREIKQVEFIPDQPVFSYIQPELMGEELVISHNGRIITTEEYQTLIPVPGDYIATCPVIEGGGGQGGKDIGRTLAMIALTIVTMGMGSMAAGGAFWGAGAIGSANWGFWSWVAAAGAYTAGGYLINQMFPTSQKDGEDHKQSYNWGQLSPITTEGKAVPITFGTVRMGVMAPLQMLTQHVTTDGEKQYLNLLLCGGEGTVDSISELTIDDNPYSNYDGVTYETRLGVNDQSVITNFNDTYFPQSVNFELIKNAAPSISQLNGEYEGIEAVIDFPAGLYRTDTRDGDIESTSVEVKLQYRLVGGHTWTDWDTITISGKYTHAIRRVYTKHHLPKGQYEISVQCTNKSGTAENYINKVHWTSLAGIIYDDFTYPNKVLLGLKALATDQLSGGMPRVQWTQTRNNVLVWNPAAGAYVQKPANNPAWACYDIIHRCRRLMNINTGQYEYVSFGIPAARIDYQAYVEWAAFCDNRGIEFNGVIYQTKTLWESLKQPEQAGRGKVLMRGTKFSCVCDAPSNAVQLFNISNITEDSFKEEFLGTQDRANALELTFYNIENGYKKTTIPVYGPEYDEATAVQNPTQISLDFAMTLDQAYRYGAYQLRVNHYINRSISWNADIDAIACQVGDVVLVQHDVPRWGTGGRILATTADTVSLDNEVTLSPGVSYSIMVRLQDDTLVEKSVQSVAQETTTDILTVSTPFASIPQEYDLFSFGEVEKVAKPVRLTSVTRQGDFRCKLQGLEYIQEVYGEAVNVPVINYNQYTGEISNVSVIQYIEDQIAMLGLSWDPPETLYGGARIFINGSQVGQVQAHENSFDYSINYIPEGEEIIVKIEALDIFSNLIDDAVEYWTVQEKTDTPKDVSWGICSFIDKIVLRCVQEVDYNRTGYEFRTDNNFGSDDAGLVYRGQEASFEIDKPDQRELTFYVKAFNRDGKYSVNVDSITLTNDAPPAPPVPTITAFFSGFWIIVEPVPGVNDISGYYLYMTPSDGAGNPLDGAVAQKKRVNPGKVDITASTGSSFLFEVSAVDALGEGPKSTPVEATTSDIPANVIGDPQIKDAAVTAQKLADAAVEGRSIADGAVIEQKLANLAVTAQKLADGAVSGNKIQDGAVLTGKLKDAAVTAQKLAEGAVEDRHINSVSGTKLIGGTIEENKMKWNQHLIF